MKIEVLVLPPVDKKHAEVLAVGTHHQVIETPKEYKNSPVRGVWVQGNGEPVKLLSSEYKFVDE